MLHRRATWIVAAAISAAACSGSGYAVRPVPRILSDNVGQPVQVLQDAFGEPRKIETGPTKLVYIWFIAQAPAGAPLGFHGCQMEVTVDPRSQRVLGVALSNVGWAKCAEIDRKIRVAAN